MQKLKLAGGLNRVFQNMEKFVTCILSGYREFSYNYGTKDNIPTWESLPGIETEEYASLEEKRIRNKILEKKLRDSGLGFNKCAGGFVEKHNSSEQITEYSYIVYNNRFPDEKFIKLMIYFGQKFDQDSILISRPILNKDRTKLANIEADYYATSTREGAIGTKTLHFDNISMQDINMFFTKIYGKKFKFASIPEEVELFSKPSGSFAMNSMEHRFAKMYPFLCDKE